MRKILKIFLGMTLGVVLIAAIVCLVVVNSPIYYYRSTTAGVKSLEFPDYADWELSEAQRNILDIAKEQYGNPKDGTFYADGANEPWCADFVSWIYKEAGHPFANPNTGGWRIPGIYTLREYFESVGAWHSEETYVPAVGNVIIYDHGVFGGHTTLVIEVTDDYIMTIGGNEDNQIRLRKLDYRDEKYGAVGFGHVLEED